MVWSSLSVACTSVHVFSRWRALRLFGELTVGCRIVVATIAVGCRIVCLASQLLSGVHAARRSRRRAGCRLSPTVRRGDFDATSANMAPPLLGDGLTPRPPDLQSLTANFRTPASSGMLVIQAEFDTGSVGLCMSSVVSAQVLRELTHRLPRWLDGSVWVLRVIGGSVPAFGVSLERARQLLRELTLIDSLRRVRE